MDSNSSGAPRMPKAYYSTYRQYKENEKHILYWVHDTTAEIRARRETAAPPPPTTSRTRAQKSKGRNHHGGPTKTHATVDPDFASAKIPFSLFIRLVEEIANSDAVIPISYLNILQLSIKQRKHIAAYYSPDADVTQTNKSHLHAIRAYMQAFEILRKAEAKRTKKDVKGHLRQSADDVEDNIFSLSEAINQVSATLEEESIHTSAPVGSTDNEWIRDNPMIHSQAKAIDKPKKQRTFPLEEYELVMDDYVEPKSKKPSPDQAEAEVFDALECFLVDVYAMRKYCNEVWKSVVPVGQTSHIAASFVTNKAVQLVKEMEYALLAEFPVLKDMGKCYQHLMNIVTAGIVTKNGDQKVLDSLLDQIMWHTYESLVSFGELLEKSPSPVLRDGHYGYFDPLADREKMSSREKFLEDRCLMCNHWPDLIVAHKLIHDVQPRKLLGGQGLVRDFKVFCDSKSPRHVSWALIFACQMQADSVLARRRHLHYDLDVMRTLGRMIGKEYLDFVRDGVLYDVNMDVIARPFVVRSAVEIYNSLEMDRITEVKFKSEWDKLSEQATQPDAFWLQNSWLTANVIAEASLDFYFAGVSVMGAGGFVQSMLQLWNMLSQTGYLPPRAVSAIIFKDSVEFVPKDHVRLFDHLIDVFGDKVFSGPPPKNNFLISWEIMMGVRPEAFARGKRKVKKGSELHRGIAHNESGRGVEAPISDLYNMHEANYFTNPKPLSSTDKSKNRQKHPLAATLDLVNSELGQSVTLPGSQEPFAPRGPLFNINLFKVHRLCVNLFTALEPVLRPEIERFIRSPLDHNQINWPSLTSWIAMTEQSPGNGGTPDRIMLKKAAEVVLKFAGEAELGSFLVREEGDESLIL